MKRQGRGVRDATRPVSLLLLSLMRGLVVMIVTMAGRSLARQWYKVWRLSTGFCVHRNTINCALARDNKMAHSILCNCEAAKNSS